MAEDYATADILTGGRLIFGVGRGYHSREVESFGNPMLDGEANRELFEEQIEIILKAFNQTSFSHQGKYYTIPPAVPYRGYQLKELSLVPRPVHLPVEIWQPIVSGSARGLEFMIGIGIKGVVSPPPSSSPTGGSATIRPWRARTGGNYSSVRSDPRIPDEYRRHPGARRAQGAPVLRGAREVHGAAGDAALQRGAREGGRGAQASITHRRDDRERRAEPHLALRTAEEFIGYRGRRALLSGLEHVTVSCPLGTRRRS